MIFHWFLLAGGGALVGALYHEVGFIRVQVGIDVESTGGFAGVGAGDILEVHSGVPGEIVRVRCQVRLFYFGDCGSPERCALAALHHVDVLDGEVRLGLVIHDVEAGHYAFEVDVHFGDAADLGDTFTRHQKRGFDQGGPGVILRKSGFEIGFGGAGRGDGAGGIGDYFRQRIQNFRACFVIELRGGAVVRHAEQLYPGQSFEFVRIEDAFLGGAGILDLEVSGCGGRGVIVRTLGPCFKVIEGARLGCGGKEIDVQLIYLVLTLGGDGTGVFLALACSAKGDLDLGAAVRGTVTGFTQFAVGATYCKARKGEQRD